MLMKKAVATPGTDSIRRELKVLYNRRMAVDHLIRSLERYDRCRGRDLAVKKTKNSVN